MSHDQHMTHTQRAKVPRGRAFALYALIVCCVFAADQVTKHLVRTSIDPGAEVTFIPGLFDLTYVYNTGGGFSLFEGATAYFVVVAVAIVLATIAYLAYFKEHSRLAVVTFALVAGGSLGNLCDRLLFSGRVTDFIATTFISFPIFNVADIAVTLGCALFIILVLVTPNDDKRGDDDE